MHGGGGRLRGRERRSGRPGRDSVPDQDRERGRLLARLLEMRKRWRDEVGQGGTREAKTHAAAGKHVLALDQSGRLGRLIECGRELSDLRAERWLASAV